MMQAFIVVLRESFESFLIVAIIISYLQKTERRELVPAVVWGIGVSLLTSTALGFWLWQGANGPLWEGIFGLVSAVFVLTLVVHMWRTAGSLKKEMESSLSIKTAGKAGWAAMSGVFLFTVLMISREGMETALLLIQIHEPNILAGAALGAAGALVFSLLWLRCGHLINVKRFFQVTSIFLFLFVFQILLYSFHEFTEAGVLPHSEALHIATEPYSPDGLYGRWITPLMVVVCSFWLLWAWLKDRSVRSAHSSNAAVR